MYEMHWHFYYKHLANYENYPYLQKRSAIIQEIFGDNDPYTANANEGYCLL